MAEEKRPLRRLDRGRGGLGMTGSTAEPTRDVVGIVSPLDNPNDVIKTTTTPQLLGS